MDIWSNEWWLKPQWREQINLSDGEIKRRFDTLRSIFNLAWVATLGDDPRYHPLVQYVTFGEGRHQIDHLLGLAHEIDNLESVNGFEAVLKSYKTISGNRSAELEMFMASCLIDGGYRAEFIPPKSRKGKTPDILASGNGKQFTVECKYLSIGSADKWIQEYRIHFGNKIFSAAPTGVDIIYISSDQSLDIWSYGYPGDLIPAKLSAELDSLPITSAVIRKLDCGRFPLYFSVPNKGEVMLLVKGSEPRGRVSVPELNTRFLLTRLLRNGLEAASKQIRGYGLPGIVAIFQSEPAEPHFIKQDFDRIVSEKPYEYRLIMGMIVFPSQNILEYIRPYWISNGSSGYQPSDFGIVNFLDEFFEPIKL